VKRLAIVVVIALAGFAAAFVAFGDAARRNCVLDATSNPAYSAEFDDVRVGEDTKVLRVVRDGQPVSDAWVCVNVAPAGGSGAGVAAEARELAAGRYGVSLDVTNTGPWRGTVLVEDDPGHPVAIPVTFEVAGGD